MTGPTPRQQAGYLRRLLRRGEVVVRDVRSGRALPVIVELQGDVISLLPIAEAADSAGSAPQEALRWAGVMSRLRRALPLEDAEDLVDAVEAEAGRKSLENAGS
ncbi:MAG: hypothetical protein FJ108_01880 [Deltaproteobacteria bacterium]|nr:hypothetical protein [Deltaproteobacteria bacterium]